MSQKNVEAVRGVRYRVTLPDERAARRRSLDERLFVRLPALYHLIAAALMRLPPRSRFRRLILTRYVRRAYAAINRRDFEVLFLGLDPDIEYIAAGDVLPPGLFPPVSHGHAGYEGNWRLLIDSFEDFRLEPEEVFDMGDTLLACNRYVGHGSGSGVPVEVSAFQLVRLRTAWRSGRRTFLIAPRPSKPPGFRSRRCRRRTSRSSGEASMPSAEVTLKGFLMTSRPSGSARPPGVG